ncbi:ribonuclease P [Sulfolobus sp. SCGC AB-777_L09]|jgi:ribonuclease P protein subunit POP4|nr:ribonuclease P protein subunit [Sulfolobaceae archaeon]PVU70711.1 ribonuclease P [Sulfolobus sp. SCGC AB-777_L09]
MDLIGATIKVLSHSDPSLIGRQGIVILETQKTFLIKEGNKSIRVLKQNGIFQINFKSRSLIIPGSQLVGKLEKRWWLNG